MKMLVALALLTSAALSHAGFTPIPADPNAIHVANAGANSSDCGPISKPCKTLKYAVDKVRIGTSYQILLRRGDDFRAEGDFYLKSGKPGAPAIIAYYGTGDRPKVHRINTFKAAQAVWRRIILLPAMQSAS